LSIAPCFSGNCAEKRSLPNIVILLTDDQGFGELGATGNPLIRTPHIDRLAAQGVSFDQLSRHAGLLAHAGLPDDGAL
jgi:hypothetical protein